MKKGILNTGGMSIRVTDMSCVQIMRSGHTKAIGVILDWPLDRVLYYRPDFQPLADWVSGLARINIKGTFLSDAKQIWEGGGLYTSLPLCAELLVK